MKIMRLVWNILMLVTVAGILTIGVLLYGASALGMETFVISGDNMEPAYKANSIAYVKKQDSYSIGDVVLFDFQSEDGNGVAIGRIYKINEDGSYVTKSDAGENVDAGLRYDNTIVGIVKGNIPYIGAIPGALSTLNSIYIVLGVALLLISATIIINVVYNESFREEKEIAQMIEEDIEAKSKEQEAQSEVEEAKSTRQQMYADSGSHIHSAEEPNQHHLIADQNLDAKSEEAYVPIGVTDAIVQRATEPSTEEVCTKDEVYKPIGNDDDASVYEVIYRKNRVN